MRLLPTPPIAVAKIQSLLSDSHPAATATATGTATCGPDTCKWKPYSNSSDFEANAVIIIIVLVCALTCALALNTAIRCFLRNNNDDQQQRLRSPENQRQRQINKPSAEVATASLAATPTLVYSAGMKLTGAEAECVICLSEFMEGDEIQVLERCDHGFHMQCIRKWLYSHYSCPICRCNCLLSPASYPPAQQPQLAVPETEQP